MECASRALFRLVLVQAPGHLAWGVRILVGRGNNGGDGLALARHLASRGVQVQVFCASSPPSSGSAPLGDAGLNHLLVGAALHSGSSSLALAPLTLEFLTQSAPFRGLWVDALLGTGFQGALRPHLLALIEALNERHESVLAVDVPSGLDAAIGQPGPVAVRARWTGTLGADKVGFSHTSSREWTGTVHVLDIGWPRRVLREAARQE